MTLRTSYATAFLLVDLCLLTAVFVSLAGLAAFVWSSQ